MPKCAEQQRDTCATHRHRQMRCWTDFGREDGAAGPEKRARAPFLNNVGVCKMHGPAPLVPQFYAAALGPRATVRPGWRKTQCGWDFKLRVERKRRFGRPPTSTCAADISTPAVNQHNENPSLYALGKAHPHEPESDAITEVTQSRPGRADGRRTDGRTDGTASACASVGSDRTVDGQTDGRSGLGLRLGRIGRPTDGRTEGRTDGRPNGGTDGRTDERTDGRTDGRTEARVP